MTGIPTAVTLNALAIEVEVGAKLAPLYPLGDGLFALDILLDEPLALGDETLLDVPDAVPLRRAPPLDRRASIRIDANVSMRVEFHPDKIPAARVVGGLGRHARRHHRARRVCPSRVALRVQAGGVHRAGRGRVHVAVVDRLGACGPLHGDRTPRPP